jgi:hypothetical protein
MFFWEAATGIVLVRGPGKNLRRQARPKKDMVTLTNAYQVACGAAVRIARRNFLKPIRNPRYCADGAILAMHEQLPVCGYRLT